MDSACAATVSALGVGVLVMTLARLSSVDAQVQLRCRDGFRLSPGES